MGIMSCDCEKPEPKHELGVFCVKCRGFIEVNNEARRKKSNSNTTVPKSTFQWHEQEAPIKAPFSRYGDVVIVEVPVMAHMVWSDKIVRDMDEDGNKEFTNGWIMEIPAQKIVFNDHNYTHVCNAMPEETKDSRKSLDKNLQ